MIDITIGRGCGIKATLLTPSGAVCDLRRARYIAASLVLPSGETMNCEELSFSRTTHAVYVKLSGARELTTIGAYGILFNIKLGDNVMYATPVVNFAQVVENADEGYLEVVLSLSIVVVDFPANVAYTGASPKVSSRNTWLVYNDEQNAYIDTGVRVFNSAPSLHLHTRRINDKLTHSYQLDTVIDGATEAELAAMGDTSQYRLVLMRLRKSPKQGRSWHIPMLPYERAKRPGAKPYTGAIAEGDTWWAVTGRIVPWWGGAKSLEEVLPLTTRIRKERRIFRNVRNVKMQVGVALFRRTNYGGEGWERISDIARIELYVPKSEASAIQINII